MAQTASDYDRSVQDLLKSTDPASLGLGPKTPPVRKTLTLPGKGPKLSQYDQGVQDLMAETDPKSVLKVPRETQTDDGSILKGSAGGVYNTARGLVTGLAGDVAGLADIPVHAAGKAMGFKVPEPEDVQDWIESLGEFRSDKPKTEGAAEATSTALGDVLGAAGKGASWLSEASRRDELIESYQRKGMTFYAARAQAEKDMQANPTDPARLKMIEGVANNAAMMVGAKGPMAKADRAIEDRRNAQAKVPVENTPPPPPVHTEVQEGASTSGKSQSGYKPPTVGPKAEQPPADVKATTASVPVMITKKMRAQLKAAGYSDEQIGRLTPEQAHAAINKAASPAAGPSTPKSPDLSRAMNATQVNTSTPMESIPPEYVLNKIRFLAGDKRDSVVPVKTMYEEPADAELFKVGDYFLNRHPQGEIRLNTADPRDMEMMQSLRQYLHDNKPGWMQNDMRFNFNYARSFAREVRDLHERGYNVLRDHLEKSHPDNPRGELRANPEKYAFETRVPRYVPKDTYLKCF